ncbi:hypothetical protein JCM31598_16780 [Desulfonatronum parangueonense]
MSISGIETAWQSPGMQRASGVANKANFGAAVVEKTMDYLNNAPASSPTPVDQQTFGAAVVNKTFDYMNNASGGAKGGFGDMEQTYNFVKEVLGAHATGKGAIANIIT